MTLHTLLTQESTQCLHSKALHLSGSSQRVMERWRAPIDAGENVSRPMPTTYLLAVHLEVSLLLIHHPIVKRPQPLPHLFALFYRCWGCPLSSGYSSRGPHPPAPDKSGRPGRTTSRTLTTAHLHLLKVSMGRSRMKQTIHQTMQCLISCQAVLPVLPVLLHGHGHKSDQSRRYCKHLGLGFFG